MMDSREAVVDYMTPLGLAASHGHGASLRARAVGERSQSRRLEPDLLPSRGCERHRLRSRSGGQQCDLAIHAGSRREVFADPKKVPEQFLLWFHHLPWDHRMSSGRTLWDEIVFRYTRGVERSGDMRDTWHELKIARHVRTTSTRSATRRSAAFLQIQVRRGAVVARRLHRVFPEHQQAAVAGGLCAAEASARVLQVTEVSVRARARLSRHFLKGKVMRSLLICGLLACARAAFAAPIRCRRRRARPQSRITS